MRGAIVTVLVVIFVAAAPATGGPAQTPKRGGDVVVAMNSLSEPSCLNWLPVCGGVNNPRVQWLDKILARPFVPGPYGWRHHLVERYERTSDPFTITFHIRPQARWSDGTPISARDFVLAYNTYLEHSYLADVNPAFRTAIRRVQPVDAKTVRFVFRAPYGDWLSLLNFPPLPRHVLRGQDLASQDLWGRRIENPKSGKPIASGPFLMGQWELGKHVTLVRNPRYWGPHPAYLDRIVLRFVGFEDIVQALRSGAFDLGVVLPPSPELQGDPRFDLLPTRWSSWQLFEIRVERGGHPALEKKLVRRALAYGIDRVELVRALFGASAPPVLDSAVYMAGDRRYEPNWRRYRYRPAEARRLLERAGCSRGTGGIYSCAGERLRLRLVTTAGVSVRERTLEIVKTQLRRAGVEVETQYAPNAQLFGQILPDGNFDVALFGRANTAPEAARIDYRCGDSASGYCSRLLNADYDQLDRILEPARRAAVANRIDRRLADAVPAIPLFQTPLVYVVRKRLQGVVPNGFGVLNTGGTLWNAENWWLARER